MDRDQSYLRRTVNAGGASRRAVVVTGFLALLGGGICRSETVPIASMTAGQLPLESKSHWIVPEIALSFPQPLQVGAEWVRAENERIRYFADGGYFGLPIRSGQGSLTLLSVQAGIRYAPMNNWVFLVLGGGYRYAAVSADTSAFKIDDEVMATDGKVGLHSFFGKIGVGAEFHLTEKVLIGSELAYQFPILGSATVNLVDSNTGRDSSSSDILAVDAEPLSRVARLGLPELTLVRFRILLD